MVTTIIRTIWQRVRKLGSDPSEPAPGFAQQRTSSELIDAAENQREPTRPAALTKFPIVGIVTPTRNRRDWTVRYAQTLCEQDYPLFRLYIVDSASTDGTAEAIRQLALSPITVIDAPSSSYWTGSTNAGVSLALIDGCDYILTLNDDAIIPNDFISNIVAAASGRGALIVGSVISYVSEPGRLWGVGAYNSWRNGAFVQTKFANLWESALASNERNDSEDLIETEYLCGNGTLVHRSVFERIGPYDHKHTPHYHADTEFTMRAEKAGIERWISTRARLYNRFTEATDGTFAQKNMRFFSPRSANYVRPILFILDRYCPPEYRARAFVLYFARYLRSIDARYRSKLLRVIYYLVLPAEDRKRWIVKLLPPIDRDLAFVEDVDILQNLPASEFVLAVYAYLLGRACSGAELEAYLGALAAGKPRSEILLEFIKSSEYRDTWRAPNTSEFQLLVTAQLKPADLAKSVPNFSNSQFVIASYLALCGRPPIRRRFDEILEVVRTSGRLQALRSIQTMGGSPSVKDKNSAEELFISLQNVITRPKTDEYVRESGNALRVYFNVDVLCMAITDPRARTGVFRYVSAIAREFLRDPRLDVHAFFSEELANKWMTLVDSSPDWRGKEANKSDTIPDRSVVFYPYFPFGRCDPRLANLPKLMTLCDLFPLTRPDWFTAFASQNFRRQLHELATTAHVFCISQATLLDLRGAFPSLKATSSVAYLAAELSNGAKSRTIGEITGLAPGRRYFVCVGTIEPRKNLISVVRALPRLADYPGAREIDMLVVGQEGWNVTSEELRALAGDHLPKIHLLGRVADEDLRSLYTNAICTVFPSLAEGFGLPIIESFSCGTPAVTSNRSSMKEIAGLGAILVDPLSPDQIAAAINEIANAPGVRADLSLKATLRAKDFSWERCAEDHIAVFQHLVGDPSNTGTVPDVRTLSSHASVPVYANRPTD